MLYEEERKSKIVQFINENKRATVQDFCSLLNVSEATIRRDLKFLEESKKLKRTHGGAVSLETVTFEPDFLEKKGKFIKEKKAIGKKASELIKEGETILLDSGTTTKSLAEELKKFSNLVVVTNSFLILQELEFHSGIEVMMLGGTLRKETLAFVGPFAEQSLSMIQVDKAFIGMNGVSVEDGLTTPNLIEARIKKMMIQNSKQSILLTDHSKVDKITFAKVGDVHELDVCVMDEAPAEFQRDLEQLGVELILTH